MPTSDELLPMTLAVAVPMRIMQLQAKGGPTDADRERCRQFNEDMQDTPSLGESLLFKVNKKGTSARAFNELAHALAVMAYQPGGVTFCELHFCADHAACLAAGYTTKKENL